jgi:hypothetical protein
MSMSDNEVDTKKGSFKISLDTWAVLAAFLAALLIRIGVVKHVIW